MVTLRIQELAEAKGITLEQLSQDCCISVEKVQKYASESIEIHEDTAIELKKIANRLEINSLDLLQSNHNSSFIRLNILKKIQEKSLTLEALSEKSGVHISVLAFYTTQPISQERLSEAKINEDMEKICAGLESSLEELIIEEANIPLIKYDIDQVINNANLSSPEFSLLSNISEDGIDLIRNQALASLQDFNNAATPEGLGEIWCAYLGRVVPIWKCEEVNQRNWNELL